MSQCFPNNQVIKACSPIRQSQQVKSLFTKVDNLKTLVNYVITPGCSLGCSSKGQCHQGIHGGPAAEAW